MSLSEASRGSFSQRREDQEVKSAAHLPCRISLEMRVIARSTIEIDVAIIVGIGEGDRGERSREEKGAELGAGR